MRLHFKEKAYKQALINDGYEVDGLFLFRSSKGADSTHEDYYVFAKVKKDGEPFVYVCVRYFKNSAKIYEKLITNIDIYRSNFTFKPMHYSKYEFISYQIVNRILFSNLGMVKIDDDKLHAFSNSIREEFDCEIHFSNNIDSLDISELFCTSDKRTEEFYD